jgi:hypothetical protein
MFVPIAAWAFFMGFAARMLDENESLGRIFGSGLAINLFLTASEFRSLTKQVDTVGGVLIVYLGIC